MFSREKPYDTPAPGPDPLGSPSAKPADAPPQYQTPFAAISLNLTDRIRLVNFPAPDIAAVRDIVLAAWEKGIQAVKESEHGTELKLWGNPWFDRYHGAENNGWKLMRALLGGLFERGWVVHSPMDLSKREGEKGA